MSSPTTDPCGHVGFSSRFTCKLPKGHEGNHDYGFLPDPVSSPKVPPHEAIPWTIEEGRTKGRFDVFQDRRAAAYDLDLQEAVGWIKRHRSYRNGDPVVAIDQGGRRIELIR